MAIEVSRGMGVRRTKFADADTHPHVSQHPRFAAAMSAAPPAAASLVGHAPAVMDQGQSGSCEGCGWACGITTHCTAIGEPLDFVASPEGIYTPARCIERAAFPEGPAEPLGDDGTDSHAVIRALGSYGVRPMRAPTPDGRYCDCYAPTINAEPSLTDLELADKTRLFGAYEITGDQATRAAAIRSCIAAGIPVVIETFVDTAYMSLGRGVVVDSCDRADPHGGGHCQVILAYRTRPDGASEFLIRNSWSQDWADEGSVWCTEAFIASAWNLYAVDVRRQP